MTWHTYDAIMHGLLVVGALILVPTAFIWTVHEMWAEFVWARRWNKRQATIHHPASVRSYVVPIRPGRVYDWQKEEQPHADIHASGPHDTHRQGGRTPGS